MPRIAVSLTFPLMIATAAKVVAAPDASPDAAKQPAGRSEIRAILTAEKADAADQPARSDNGALRSPALPAWLEDPSVMDGSWRRWPSLTDF